MNGYFTAAERFIMRPIAAVLMIAGWAYMFAGAWFTGVFLIVMALFIGAIGQGLPHNGHKTFQELTLGSTGDQAQSKAIDDMSPAEFMQLGRMAMWTGVWTGLAAGVVAGHHGSPWYCSIPVGFACNIVVCLLLFVCGAAVAAKSTKFIDPHVVQHGSDRLRQKDRDQRLREQEQGDRKGDITDILTKTQP